MEKVWPLSLIDVVEIDPAVTKAAEAFKQALDLNPDDVLAYVNLAKALEIQQRFEEAIAVLGDGVKIMLRQGRKEKASADLNKLRELLEIQKQNLK